VVSQLERTVRVNQLFDLYAGLLTERQRRVIYLYHAMDLSLGEIADRTGVTRQAVHDALVRGVNALESADARLDFLRRWRSLQSLTDALSRSLGGPESQGARAILAEIQRTNPLG